MVPTPNKLLLKFRSHEVSTDLSLCFQLSGAKVYERAKRLREEERRKRTMLCDVLQYIQDGRACQQWLSKQAAM